MCRASWSVPTVVELRNTDNEETARDRDRSWVILSHRSPEHGLTQLDAGPWDGGSAPHRHSRPYCRAKYGALRALQWRSQTWFNSSVRECIHSANGVHRCNVLQLIGGSSGSPTVVIILRVILRISSLSLSPTLADKGRDGIYRGVILLRIMLLARDSIFRKLLPDQGGHTLAVNSAAATICKNA